MACCCGAPNCYSCNAIATRDTTDSAPYDGFCNYETRQDYCGGYIVLARGEACDCINNNGGVQPCSYWNIPETSQYSNCNCVELSAQCEAAIYGGNCSCVMYNNIFRVVKTLFYFDGGTCKWTKLAQTSDVSNRFYFQTGSCDGIDPPTELPNCTPLACDGPYNPVGCTGCNPLP